MQSAFHSQSTNLGAVPITLLDALNDLVAAVDTEHRVIALNERYRRESERLLGAKYVLGQKLEDALAHVPEHQARARELWTRALAGEPFTITLVFDSDAGEQHYECRYSPLRGPNGDIIGAMHIARNVTAEVFAARDALAALEREQQSHARLNAVVDSISDAFLAVDARGQVTHLNAAAERMLRLHRSALLGRDVRDHLPVQSISAAGRVCFQHDGRMLEMYDTPGSAGGRLLWFRDITDLRALQRRHELAFNQSAVGMVLCQSDGVFVDVNPGFAHLLGYSPEELVGRSVFDVTHPDDLALDLQEARKVLAGEQTGYTIEKRYIRNDGSVIWVLLNTTLVRDQNGKQFASGVIQDISERKRAEEALRESEANYRNFVELSPQFPWTAGPDGNLLHFNERLLRRAGITREEALSGDRWRYILGEDLERTHAAWSHAVATGEPYDIEHRMHFADGSHRWMRSRAWPLRNSSGAIVRWYGATEDIHVRKSAEEALAASRQRFQAIFDQAFGFIFLLSPDGTLLEANRTALEFAGIEIPAVQATPFWQTPWWSHSEAAQQQLREAIARAASGDFVRYEVQLQGAGRLAPIDFSIRPLFDSAGKVVQLIPEGRDISAQRDAERQRDQQRQTFQSIAQATPDLLYIYDLVERRNAYLNGQIQRLLGYTEADIAAFGTELFSNIVHPDDLHVIATNLARFHSVDDEEVLTTEYRLRRKDGQWRWFSGRDVVFTRDPAGAPRLLLGVATDITARKRMEDQLRRAREQFAIAAAATRALVYDWNLETGHVERVCGLRELTGWDPAEVPPDAEWWRDQCHPEDLVGVKDLLPDIIPGQPRSAEYRVRHKNGHYIYVRDTAVLLANEDGKLVRSVGSTIDITHQRAAEAALVESEERFRTIAEAMPHNAYIAARDRSVEYANSQLLQYIGLPVGSLDHDIWRTLIYPDDYDSAAAAWDSAATDGCAVQTELRLRGADGRYCWMLHRIVPLRSSGGEVARWLGTLTDIHDRHTLEEGLRASESQLRQMADALPQLVWVANPTGLDEWHNKRWLEYSGATEAELRGDGWSDFIHPDDRDRARQRWRNSIDTGQHYEILYRVRRYDGEYRWMLNRAVPIYDEQRNISSWFGTCTDVHEQKRLEDALRASEQQLQLALSAAQLGIWSFDPNTGHVDWDLRTRKMFGVRPYDHVDYETVVDGIIHPDDRQRVHETAQRALSPSGDGRYQIEHRIVSPEDGSLRWLMVSGRVFFDGDGTVRKPARMTGAVADITERKRIEEALIRSNQDLERFAYMASHDLREPLRAVRTFSELLERRYKGKLDPAADQYLDFLMSGTERMNRLIDDLLAFGRVTADAELMPEPVDCDQALSSALAALQSAIAETSAAITYDPLPVVQGYAGLIPQLFQNLIGNAIKYRRPNVRPQIHIQAVLQHSWVFSVRDNGLGFASEDASRIFSVFTRLNREHGAGSGLGLAICQRIVERHNGRIWAESEPGAGSTFWFTLPALDRSSARTE